MPARRLAAVITVAVASAVLLGTVAATGSPAASASPDVRSSAVYAVNKPLCVQPADPRAARCFAVEQVRVPRTTVGAYRVAGTGGAVARPAAAAAFSGYTPAQLATAYGFNPKAKRSQLTVGIVLWHDSPNVLRDLNVFDRRNHLPTETARSFRKVNANGKPRPLPKRDRSTAGEVAVDTQAVRGVCNTCRILLVEAQGPYDDDLAKAVDTAVRLGASVVTNSYGVPEHRMPAAFAKAYHHPGVAILAATGDAGWYGWDFANSKYGADNAPSYPATSPDVIAVGGTTLKLGPGNRWLSETAWNNNGAHNAAGSARRQPLGASGGGCSTMFKAPAWQRRTPGYAAAQCHGKRLAADLALVADPSTGYQVYDSYGSGGWVVIGGTSLSSPLAAGMLALAGGPHGARFPATAIYGSASARTGVRHDVTSGGTGYCGADTPKACAAATKQAWGTNNPNRLVYGAALDCSFARTNSEAVPSAVNRACTAVRGFDGPTGVGTPMSTRLFARTDPYLKLKSTGKIKHGHRAKFRVAISTPVADTRITSLRFGWGDKRTTTTTRRSASHKYRKPGRYAVTVTSNDSRGQTVIVRRAVRVR